MLKHNGTRHAFWAEADHGNFGSLLRGIGCLVQGMLVQGMGHFGPRPRVEMAHGIGLK